MAVIVINPNHGLSTPGRRTPDGKFLEWQLNDAIGDIIVKRLNEYENVKVLRADNDEGVVNETLAARTAVANNNKADLMITIDHNANKGVWGTHGGVVTLITTRNKPAKAKSKELAETMSDSIAKLTGMRNRGVKEVDFYVLRESTMPTINIEVGFMDSRVDYPIITNPEWQRKIGYLIADNAAKFLNLTLKSKPVEKPVEEKNIKTKPKFSYISMPLSASRYALKAPYEMPFIDGVTIHETDNSASAQAEIAYMQRNNNLVSFHYAVDELGVYQGLPLERNGWHAGDGTNGRGNRRTIGIEVRNNLQSGNLEQYRAARANAEKLVGWLMYVYGFEVDDIELGIFIHKDWSGKNCPRRMIADNYMPTFKVNAKKHMDSYKAVVVVPPVVEKISKLKEGMKVKIKADAGRYANIDKAIPEWVKKQTYTIKAVNNDTKSVLLQEILSWVKMHDIEGYEIAYPAIPENLQFKVGDMVVVKAGSVSYTGATVIPQWYFTPKRIDSLNGARAVLDINGWCTAFNVKDLNLSKVREAEPAPAPISSIKLRDLVLVKQGAKSYNGKSVSSGWFTTPKLVDQIVGDRVLLDAGGWNTNFNIKDLVKAPGIAAPQLKVGSKVTFVGTTYATGQNVPAAYRNKVYTVQQIDTAKERVLLKEILSWAKIRDVK